MKKIIFLILLMSCVVMAQTQAPAKRYVAPFSLAGLTPTNGFAFVGLDSSGSLITGAGQGNGLNLIKGYVTPFAPMAKDPNGVFQYLNLDSSGALKVSSSVLGGGGNLTWDNTNNKLAIGPPLTPIAGHVIAGPLTAGLVQESAFTQDVQDEINLTDNSVFTGIFSGSSAGSTLSVYSQNTTTSMQISSAITAAQAVYGRGSSSGLYSVGISVPGAGVSTQEFAAGVFGSAEFGSRYAGVGSDQGTAPAMASFYAGANTNYGAQANVAVNAGLFVEQQKGQAAISAGVYIMDQGTEASDYAIKVNGGQNDLGPQSTKVGTILLTSNTLTNLGTPVNGTVAYCSNCNTPITPGATCATGGDGAGAEAHRIRGIWQCY